MLIDNKKGVVILVHTVVIKKKAKSSIPNHNVLSDC